MRRIVSGSWTAIRATLVLAVLCGLIYPLVMTAVSQVVFPSQANGSLVRSTAGRLEGSTLIGQCFYQTTTVNGQVEYRMGVDDRGNAIYLINPRYFQGRPSYQTAPPVNGRVPYTAPPCQTGISGSSNLGPSSAQLKSRIDGYSDYLHRMGVAVSPSGRWEPIPIDLVTEDFSGFDPDISQAAALAQVNMVAKARGLNPAALTAYINGHVQGRVLGLFGEPVVNVLQLNMALDSGAIH